MKIYVGMMFGMKMEPMEAKMQNLKFCLVKFYSGQSVCVNVFNDQMVSKNSEIFQSYSSHLKLQNGHIICAISFCELGDMTVQSLGWKLNSVLGQ